MANTEGTKSPTDLAREALRRQAEALAKRLPKAPPK